MERKTKLIIKYVSYILCVIFAALSVVYAYNINTGCAVGFIFMCIGALVLDIDTNKH